MRPVVGVHFEAPDLRIEWVRLLAAALPNSVVGSTEATDPKRVEILVVGNPPGRELRRFPNLGFVQSTWAGVDRLNEDRPDVPVARMVAPELTRAMAEFVLTACSMLHRRVPSYLRAQSARLWRPLEHRPIAGTRVTVLGFGALGRPVAAALTAAGFDVVAWARTPREVEVSVLSGEDGWVEAMGRADILVNLLPLTPLTRGLLDRRALEMLPRGAGLVNVARGDHVVERDLLAVLDAGHLGDAILDVFSQEPLPGDHPFWSHPRVLIFPHVAAPSRPHQLAPHVAANIHRFLAGEQPLHLVEG